MSFWIRVRSGCMPGSGTDGPYGSSVFCFLISIHTGSHSGRTNLLYHQGCRILPFSQSLILKSSCAVRSTLCLEMSHLRDGEFDVSTCRATRPRHLSRHKSSCGSRPLGGSGNIARSADFRKGHDPLYQLEA